jgi:hypothetical protein
LPHLRRNDGDELLGKDRREHPGTADMLDQRLRLVLDQKIDRENLRIDQVRENEVDDPETVAERNRRLRSMLGQWTEPRAFAARQDERENVGQMGHCLASR